MWWLVQRPKKTPTSHKDSLVAVVGCVVGAENTNESSLVVMVVGDLARTYSFWSW